MGGWNDGESPGGGGSGESPAAPARRNPPGGFRFGGESPGGGGSGESSAIPARGRPFGLLRDDGESPDGGDSGETPLSPRVVRVSKAMPASSPSGGASPRVSVDGALLRSAIDLLSSSEPDVPRSARSVLSSVRASRLILEDVFGATAESASLALESLRPERRAHHFSSAARAISELASTLPDPAAALAARAIFDRLASASASASPRAGRGSGERE
jgi:hypothetical protein